MIDPLSSVKLKFLTEGEAAAITGFSVHKFRQDRFHCRGFPYVKIGRSVRYAEEDLKAYMAAHRITPDSKQE